MLGLLSVVSIYNSHFQFSAALKGSAAFYSSSTLDMDDLLWPRPCTSFPFVPTGLVCQGLDTLK